MACWAGLCWLESVSLCGCEHGVGGRGIFLFASSGGHRCVTCEGIRSWFLPGHNPRQPCSHLCPWYCLKLGPEGGTVSALAHQTLGLHALLTSYMYLFIEDLYPPTSSRVIFAQWEHSEVTLAKNNPERAGGGGEGGGWELVLSSVGQPTASVTHSTWEAEPSTQCPPE